MNLAGAETSVHERAQLAFAAAASSGLPGEFRAREVDGLRVVMTTSPHLGFLNSVTGLDEMSAAGLPGVLDDFHAAGAPSPSLVTGPLTPGLTELLLSQGFRAGAARPIAFVALPIDGADRLHEVGVDRPDVTEVQTIDERAVFLDVLSAGYSAPVDVERFLRAEHSAGAVRGFLAWAGSEPVGAAAMSLHGTTVVLGGAATLSHHRGSGAQTALLGHRLQAAVDAGALSATATAAPRSPSARNLTRAGFHLELRTAWLSNASR